MTTRNRMLLLAFALGSLPGLASAAPATVTVFEAQVHAAPDRSSPVIHTFAENTEVSVSETATKGFRKVRLPDGKVGYIEDSAVTLTGAEAQPPGPPPAMRPPPPPFEGPPPPPPPYGYVPYRRVVLDPTAFHHVGPYLRMELGIGYLHSSTSATQTAFGFDSSHGFAGDFAFALGGAVKENFILAGQFWGSWAGWPTLSSHGANVSTGGAFSTSLYGIGPNFTWYLMPANVLFSVTPSLTWVDVGDYYYGSYQTDAGFGTRFTVAKEWWVAPHWSLGVSGWFVFSFNGEGSGAHATWDTYAGGIGFTTSMN